MVATNRKFVLIEPTSMSHAAFGVEFERQLRNPDSFMCMECRSLKPHIREIGPAVFENVIDDAPFGLAINDLGIARTEFFYAMGTEIVDRYFYVGPVLNQKGKEWRNWVTYHTKYQFPVRRGTQEAGSHVCPKCGGLSYFALGSPYLYPAPPEGIDVLGDSVDLIVIEELANKLRAAAKLRASWRKIKFTDLPILDKPQDGLGEIEGFMRNSPVLHHSM